MSERQKERGREAENRKIYRERRRKEKQWRQNEGERTERQEKREYKK
jgi:hypothetical protein